MKFVKEFISITSTDRATAEKYLKANTNLQAALDQFYADDYKEIDQVFDTYARDDIIDAEGTQKLLDDLEVDYDDLVTIVISMHLKSPSMCEFNREGFRQGFKDLQINTLQGLKSLLPKFRNELNDPKIFKKLYALTFTLLKQENQKSLGLDLAIAYWELLLGSKFEHLELWTTFLKDHHGKSITKDTWLQFYDFIQGFESFKSHDLDGAWPILIDNFVQYALDLGK